MLYELLHVLPRPQCLVSHSQNRTTYYHHHFPVYVCSSFQMWITRFEWVKISQFDSTVEEGKGVSAIIVISPFNISRSIIIVTFIWPCFKVCLLQFNQKYLNTLGAISTESSPWSTRRHGLSFGLYHLPPRRDVRPTVWVAVKCER